MSSVTFTINRKSYTVGSEVEANYRLLSFIRDEAGLTGTHFTCNQGGCCACVVTAKVPVPNSAEKKIISINACLANVHNCNGWEITTIEGLGNTRDGLHPIQKTLSDNYGSQCGFCTSGFIMNMYGFTEGKESWTDDEVERNLDGHICRCTGYRPIVHAFKQLKPEDKDTAVCDIEDIMETKGRCCGGGCCKKDLPLKREIRNDGTTMYYPTTVKQLTHIMSSFDEKSVYKLMFGNTGVGVTGDSFHDAIVSIRDIAELSNIETADVQYFVAGAVLSIQTLMDAMKKQESHDGFEYFTEILDHWGKVGSISMRNLGSWAGNLALKNSINSFQSDLFTTLVGCGAEVLLGKSDGTSEYVLVETLVGRNVVANREVILKLRLSNSRDHGATYYYNNYKVMPRSSTSLAYINASFSIAVGQDYKITKAPILAYGGINAELVRASTAEHVLAAGLDLTDIAVLQNTIDALDKDILPDDNLLNPPKDYRIRVAKGILYKFLMKIIVPTGKVDDYFIKAAEKMIRPTSSGEQSYDQNKSTWPLGQPIKKIESDAQCAGEIKYINDMSKSMPTGTLFGVFLQSTHANAKIDSINSSQIHSIPGIVGFLTADDIPGKNDIHPFVSSTSIVTPPHPLDHVPQPVFASGRVLYHGQAIGLLIGSDLTTLNKAVLLIKVTYSDVKTPILTIKEAIAAKKIPAKQPTPVIHGDVDAAFAKSTHIVEGEWNRGSQYHFHLESQTCTAIPFEDTYNVTATTQWPTGTQMAIASVLGTDNNKVNVTVHRLGGGFGGKQLEGNLVHAATALAAAKFRKPVHVRLTLQQNMSLIGWRSSFLMQYKIGVDADKKLNAVKLLYHDNTGWNPNNATAFIVAGCAPNCYMCDNWFIKPSIVLTDTASNTYMRGPGSSEGISSIEYAMEHMARELKMDPLEFRKLNMIPDGGMRLVSTAPTRVGDILLRYNGISDRGMTAFIIEKNYLPAMIQQMEDNADVANRKAAVTQFNKENRWRKRGLSVMPMLFPYMIDPVKGFGVLIAVYAADASVIVTAGGIEMGQGLHTKVAQMTAYELGCDMDKISMKSSTTTTGANSRATAGSWGSDVCVFCAQKAAKKIRARLDSTGGTTFEEKVKKAFATGLSLSEYYCNEAGEVKKYAVYGVSCTEVEVDTLTGNYLLLRTDLIEDCGTSPSPLVDIGQIEGAFAQGQGLFTTEEPIFNPKTGEKLNFDTWHYKPIMTRDISTDLRVTLLSNAPNPQGVANSKVVGEPPLSLAFVITLALRHAITSAREDAGNTDWFQIDCPVTVQQIQKLCLVDPKSFSYVKK